MIILGFAIFEWASSETYFLYRLYLHGSLLEDMIHENMSKFMDKMVKETEPFTPKQYFSLMIIHQLYTICFGERLVFEREIFGLVYQILTTFPPTRYSHQSLYSG